MGRQIAKAAALIMALTLMGRAVGLVREMYVAAKFPSEVLGPFAVAFNLPNLIGITLTGAFMAAFVPLFSTALEQGKREEAWRLASAVFNSVLLIFSLLVILGMIFSRQVAYLLATKFPPEQLDLTGQLLFILFPSLIFLALAGVSMGMLSSLNRYFASSLAPLLSSVVVIGSIFVLAPRRGIYGLAAGTTLGALVQFGSMLPSIIREGFRYTLTLGGDNPLVRRLWVMIGPVLLGVGVSQIHVLIDSNMAAALSDESVVALKYANTLAQLPMGVFVSAVAIPMLPALSAYLAKGDRNGYNNALTQGVNYYSIIMLPVMVVTMILSEPIIQVLFQREHFDPQLTEMTAFALLFYALGFWPSALRDLYTRGFYAYHDTTTPVRVGMLTVVVHVILNFLLIPRLAQGGLALATTIANTLNMLILGWLLYGQAGGWPFRGQLLVLGKAGLASAVMGLVLWEGYGFFLSRLGEGVLGILLAMVLAGVAAALVYGTMLLALRIPEADLWLKRLKAKLKGTRYFRHNH